MRMTDGYEYIGAPPPAPPPPAPVKRRGFWQPVTMVLTGAIVTALLAGGGLLGYVFLIRESTITVDGILVLTDRKGYKVNGVSCDPTGGYSDIGPGKQVVISDAAGTTIGIGKLDRGANLPDGCTFTFHIEGIPDGHDFYGIAIGKRGTMRYTPDQIAKPVELSLG